jgi:hypothetical protein
MAIPGNSTFSSQVLNLDDVVVSIGEYYYSKKSKWIEKRSTKREETIVIQSSTKRVIEWETGPDPKENVIHIASALHAFAGVNAMSIFDVAMTVDTAQAKITELEKKLSDKTRRHLW